MKFTTLLLLSMFLTPLTYAQSLKINAEKATVTFYVVSDKQEGSLSGFDAEISFDKEQLGKAKIKGSVDVNTIDTGNKMRDKHLKKDDYFDVEKYPKMTFESTSIKTTDKGYEVTGNLTIKSTTKEEVIAFEYDGKKFKSKLIIYGKDYNVGHGWKTREASKIFIKINVPVE